MTTATLNGASPALEAVIHMDRDLRKTVTTLTPNEARHLVDYYYQMQEYRISAAGQVRSMTDEPHEVLTWLSTQMETLEGQIKRALDTWSDSSPIGLWAKSIVGIGPVLAAGLMAHIDIEKAPTVGHIWRFAGQDPTQVWEKKTKRPWNADLKVLCWKIGESFVKVSGNERDIYGHVYASRKKLEAERNEAGQFADQAASALERKRFGADTVARTWYVQGKLPPAHIHARAKRYAVKLFLSHYHEVAYVERFGEMPPKPYVISILGHADYIPAPR